MKGPGLGQRGFDLGNCKHRGSTVKLYLTAEAQDCNTRPWYTSLAQLLSSLPGGCIFILFFFQ